jgi:type I thyroxine 5'-deiodinase
LYREYKDRAAFFVVYILEAHASDLWQLPSNIRDNVVHSSPRSFEERSALASSCVRKLNIDLPALVDDFGNSVEVDYTAWPDRLYVIDKDGKVAHKSKAGPFGFKPAEVEEALKKIAPPARG